MAKKVTTKKAAGATATAKKVAKRAPAKKKPAAKPNSSAGGGAKQKVPKGPPPGTWTLQKVMALLKSKGAEPTRKTWARHGATGPVFGVKFSDIYAIRKQIGTDHALAKGLWDTNNFDARLLATMIADGSAFTASELDRWAASVETYFLANAVGDAVARCPYGVAQAAVDRWVGSPREFLCRCGFSSLSSMLRDGVEVPVNKLRAYLRMIEERQATAPNRAREGMNLAISAIGAYSDEQMAREAIAAAKRIGPIRIDHGDTACKDFDPIVEIPKARAHRAKMAAKKKAK